MPWASRVRIPLFSTMPYSANRSISFGRANHWSIRPRSHCFSLRDDGSWFIKHTLFLTWSTLECLMRYALVFTWLSHTIREYARANESALCAKLRLVYTTSKRNRTPYRSLKTLLQLMSPTLTLLLLRYFSCNGDRSMNKFNPTLNGRAGRALRGIAPPRYSISFSASLGPLPKRIYRLIYTKDTNIAWKPLTNHSFFWPNLELLVSTNPFQIQNP